VQEPPLRTHERAASHSVQFYDDDRFLVRSIAAFVAAGLEAGEAAVIVATEPHLAAFEKQLAALGLDVAAVRAEGRYVELEAGRTLALLLRDGVPDPERFATAVADPVRRALGTRPGVRAFGEMVALLQAARKVDAALRLEELWSELARELPLAVRCAYPLSGFGSNADSGAFMRICHEHGQVLPAETYSALLHSDEQLREIARLQQRANALEAELERGRGSQESLARLAAIVGSSDDAIVGKALDGTVTSWNAGAERIFGYSAEEMIGQPILRIVPPERRAEVETILGTIQRGERVDHFETERVRKDGARIQVSVTVSPICDVSGRIIGASKIARDVTERRRLAAEREQLLALAQRALAEAQAASSVKDEFLATLSHELRNPLSAVRSAVISARLEPRERERALDLACRQVDQLSRLVDDLLDLSRITQGRVRINTQLVALKEILERAAETTRFQVEERGHALHLTLPPDSVRVEGDPVRLEQIVVNLLTNAVKYTERGGRIELVGESSGAEARIRVRDNGQGIAPSELPRVFDLFVQGTRTPRRAPGGLGIGLTVVRSLVGLHGGRIEVQSEGIGKGSEFVVYLPAVASTRESAAKTLRTAPPPSLRAHAGGGVRVMIVEDHPDAAESLAMLLELLGHQVSAVGDGFAALESAAAEPPQLMLVDVGLPGMDGYEVARRIRATEALREVRLVALTGYAREEDRRRALAAGFDHHLAKPVDPAALRNLLGRIASGDRLRADGAGSSA